MEIRQKRPHRPMEENWEPRNKPSQTQSTNIWQRSQEYSIGVW